MEFAQSLIPGTLIRRYKRFLADVELETGETVIAHCANPGAMTGLNVPGMRVWLEPNDDPRRKLGYAWRLSELPGGHWAGIDTAIPNKVVGEALRAALVPPLSGYESVKAEVRYGTASRVDFLLTHPGRPDCFVEVKNAHLCRGGTLAEFPDSVTKRGAKHLDELSKVAASGARAVMLYLIQRTDCTEFSLAADIDPAYAAAFERAGAAGVEAMAFGTQITPRGVAFGAEIPMAQVVKAE